MNGFNIREIHAAVPAVSLIFPMYNPEVRLRQTLSALSEFANSTDLVWEFVFVSDGCTDESVNLVRAWRPHRHRVRLLEFAPNRGKGFAVRQGLLAAAAPYRIFTDVDLAYSFEDIGRVAANLRAGLDVVIASRAHAQSQLELRTDLIGHAFRRHFQSQIFSMLVRTLLPIKHRDTQAGLKGLSETAVRLLVPRLTCDGFGFDCELLTACLRLGLNTIEIPVSCRLDHRSSTTNFRSTLHMVRDLFRIRRAWPAAMTNGHAQSAIQYREAG
jgi:dolichyl-phosphate beta-glucosyltransferase